MRRIKRGRRRANGIENRNASEVKVEMEEESRQK